MTILDERVTSVLTGMRSLPAHIGRDLLARLSLIEAAISEDMIEEGTILIEYRDLGDELVVIGMTVGATSAFLDVSASEEPVAISNGYSFSIGDGDVVVDVDRSHHLTPVDHGAMIAASLATDRALSHMAEARRLMRTHPAFKDMP